MEKHTNARQSWRNEIKSVKEIQTTKKQEIHLIDIHTHIYPEPYLELLQARDEIPFVKDQGAQREFVIFPEEAGPDGVGGRIIGREYWMLSEKIAFMDRFGISQSVVSLGNPWMDVFTDSAFDQNARLVNQSLADLRSQSGGRVVAMGVLPASTMDAVLEELHFIDDHPDLVGVIIGPQVLGLQFDHPGPRPFWRESQQLALPIFVHPRDGIGIEHLQGYRHTLPVGLGFPVETTVAMARLVFGGVLEEFPRLKIVAAHGGGTIPYLAGRLDAAWRSDQEIHVCLPKAPSEYLKLLYMDALVYYEPALLSLRSFVGDDHLMFGSDHPFSVSDPQVNLDNIARVIVNSADREQIHRSVTQQLYKLI
jgi:aminocarboxymuconate-semialdehyde decarboxylase